MICKRRAAVFVVAAFVSASAALVQAQETTPIGPPADSADRNAGPAGPNRADTGLPESDRTAGSGDAAARGQGTITRARKDMPGHIGKDGSLPKPNVRDDPQHRCLSPAGVC
ncbi:MAG TPA: hypothetical protein VFK79_03315 [Xanthobacteraceae bacterium]|nr:hypothetical protein [Xanthobacteraceae bacterium]